MTGAGIIGRVLVTGATGFVGTPVTAALLAAGHEVHGVSRSGASTAFPVHRIDLHDTAAVDDLLREIEPTHLVHLAWTTAHGLFWRDPANLDWAVATLSLLRSFGRSGGRRALLAGSCAEYDWSTPAPYREDQAGPPPETLYGATKLATGLASVAFGEETDVEVAWARLFHLYGPGEDDRRVVPLMLDAASRGTHLELDHPEAAVDLIHVDDAAEALVDVLHSDLTGSLNVATGRPVTLGEVASVVADLVGLRGPAPKEPGAPGRRIYADTTRLEDRIRRRPRRRLEDGLSELLAQHRSMGTDTVKETV